MDATFEPIANHAAGNMPSRGLSKAARLGRTAVLVALAVVVLAAGALLAVPQWRAMLPSGSVTYAATAPAGWRVPATAAPAALPLEPIDPTPAPTGRALAGRIATLARAASAPPGLVVIDPVTGRVLVRRGDRPLIPASTMKLLTCVVALETLGNDRRFTTSVVAPASDLVVLRGGGDPLLHDARATGRASLEQLAVTTAAALKTKGAAQVTLGYDGSLFSGRSWHQGWSENYRYSVAPIGALMAESGFRDADGRAEKDPAAAAARRFAARLAKAGIRVRTVKAMKAPGGAPELASMQSPPVEQLIEHTLRYSDNVAAETLARHSGLAGGRGGGFSGAEAAVRAGLKELGLWTTGMAIDDNSGLSRNNRVTPGALAETMKLVLGEPRFRSLLLGLPVGGVSGTLYDRFDDRSERAGRGVVRAKTGSLRDVGTLAGFLITADGSPLAFAMMANGVVRPVATRNWMDRTTSAWASCGC